MPAWRSSFLVLLVPLSMALASCAPADAPRGELIDTSRAAASGPTVMPAPTVRDTTTARDTITKPDTATIVVTGPTLVAFFPSNTQARVDADTGSTDFATIADDFMYYLGDAQEPLAARGVKVEIRLSDTLSLATTGEGARRWRWAPDPDSAEVGYYLVSPTHGPQVLYGVKVTDELLKAVGPFVEAGARR